MASLRQRLDLPPVGFPAFCLALGLVSGFLAGRDWSAKAMPGSTRSISGLMERVDDLLPRLDVVAYELTELRLNTPPPAVHDNMASAVGTQLLAVAARQNDTPEVELGDAVRIAADQRGHVYAICEPQP